MLKSVVVVLTLIGVTFSLPTSQDRDVNVRIIGGEGTTIAEHPFQLALYDHTRYICGAVLIAHNWAITTAHCVDSSQLDRLTVRAGSTRVSAGGQVVDVGRVILHQGYNRRTLDYNFALLHLKGSVAVRDSAPVKLPEAHRQVHPGEEAIITGWGQVSVDSVYPELLQVAEVPVISIEECRRAYEGYVITETMFCGGLLGFDGKDASHGDRGGPVIVGGELVGLISWAINHGSPLRPDVYASIPSVRHWIEQISGI